VSASVSKGRVATWPLRYAGVVLAACDGLDIRSPVVIVLTYQQALGA
jgi:hypothetical protein